MDFQPRDQTMEEEITSEKKKLPNELLIITRSIIEFGDRKQRRTIRLTNFILSIILAITDKYS